MLPFKLAWQEAPLNLPIHTSFSGWKLHWTYPFIPILVAVTPLHACTRTHLRTHTETHTFLLDYVSGTSMGRSFFLLVKWYCMSLRRFEGGTSLRYISCRHINIFQLWMQSDCCPFILFLIFWMLKMRWIFFSLTLLSQLFQQRKQGTVRGTKASED